MDRNEAIAQIKQSLKARSGKTWSVTGGRGTAYGWIEIHVAPKSRNEFGYMSDTDRAALATLLGLDSVHQQGVSVPAGSDYRQEYVDRAAGRAPSKVGKPYWD
jgi:hypothetical protein